MCSNTSPGQAIYKYVGKVDSCFWLSHTEPTNSFTADLWPWPTGRVTSWGVHRVTSGSWRLRTRSGTAPVTISSSGEHCRDGARIIQGWESCSATTHTVNFYLVWESSILDMDIYFVIKMTFSDHMWNVFCQKVAVLFLGNSISSLN